MISKEQRMFQSMTKLEQAFIVAVTQMRNRVAELDDPPSYFDLEISATGRVLDGELEVVFKFDPGSYEKSTKGGNLAATFEEYLRRYGWQKQNAPLCLPKVRDEEEIPF
jgi:hypothetical protein